MVSLVIFIYAAFELWCLCCIVFKGNFWIITVYTHTLNILTESDYIASDKRGYQENIFVFSLKTYYVVGTLLEALPVSTQNIHVCFTGEKRKKKKHFCFEKLANLQL